MCCNNSNKNTGNDSSGISHKDCMDLLYQFLDNEVDDKVGGQVHEHIKICMPCYERYNLDKAIKEMLKTKCIGKQVPKDLIQSIKVQITPPSPK